MRSITWSGLVLALVLLLAPSKSHAFGASLSLGGGAVLQSPVALTTTAELSPFYDIAIVRLEVPLQLRLKPNAGEFAVRPGVKVFLPLVGLYARGGIGFGNLGGDGGITKTLILGLGWELSLLDTFGIFFEATGEPTIAPTNYITAMGRAGVMLNF